jgi:Fe-S-cluster containining protein
VLALLPLIDCEQCGECCRTVPSIVAQEYEVERIARYIGVRPRKLKRKWKKREDGVWFVPSQPCMFQEENACSIHPARMVVCKYYPLQRINQNGRECIGVFGFCDAGSRCIEWLKERANGNDIS